MRALAAVVVLAAAAWRVPVPQDEARVQDLLSKLDDDSIEVRAAASAALARTWRAGHLCCWAIPASDTRPRP